MAHRRLQEEYERLVQTQPRSLSAAEREAIVHLAHNVPALWHAPTTTMAERKEIVRQIIQWVIVAGEGRSERLQITIAWIGGGSTAGVISRQSVVELMRRLGVHHPRRRRRPPLRDHEWWWSDLERVLGVANSTWHQWRKRGWLQVRWHDQSQRWVAWADEAELQRLKQRCALPPGAASHLWWLAAQRSPLNVSPDATTV